MKKTMNRISHHQKFSPHDRQALFHALAHFIEKGPRLKFGNYGDARAYRAEQRAITRDLHDARLFLRQIEVSSITYEDMRDAMRHAFGGRLSWDGATLNYCAEQDWPAEYRKAVAAVCALALRRHWWDGASQAFKAEQMQRVFGRGIASRWFN
jgi:hypothetical protein